MLKLRITKDVEKVINKMPDKFFCQIYSALESLRNNPTPHDSIILKGNIEPRRYRNDIGEYRIIYWFDTEILYVDIIGKRNDDCVYKSSKRKGII